MIRGVELRDFMSYEEALVPLSRGLNLICGPNGSGKSSILLGISLVLGQAHTERSRRLADLVRRGRPEARVSLILDNAADGGRLFPHRREDRVSVTRVLRSTGSYYYLVEGQPVTKAEVREAFHRLGIFPDNMLIIMHQLMVHKFASVPPPEKLRMLEEAVGLQGYRDEVLEALGRLRETGQEEKTLRAVLQSTEQSYEFWRTEYEKYQRKKALEGRLRQLDAELAWTRVAQGEAAVARLRSRLDGTRQDLAGVERDVGAADTRTKAADTAWDALKTERAHLEGDRLEAARRDASTSAILSWTEEWARALGELPPALREARDRSSSDADAARASFRELEERLARVNEALDAGLPGLIDGRVDGKVLRFRARMVGEEIQRIESQLRTELEELQSLTAEAERLAPRLAPRKVAEIHQEAGTIKQELGPLAHLTDEVERVYGQHVQSFDAVRARAEALAVHRRELEGELGKRAEKWRDVMDELLGEVSKDFDFLLREAEGIGRVRLSAPKDIEKSGLEILAGFRGQEPVALESFTQSGGERSLAMSAFLLALQRRIASPLRAIDEFDVHLDPHNRELVSKMIVASTGGLQDVQYLAITPGTVSPAKGVSVIIVQNVAGAAEVGRLT